MITKGVLLLQLVCSVVFIIFAHYSMLVPGKYLALLIVLVLIFLGAVAYITVIKPKKVWYQIAVAVSIIGSFAMLIVGFNIHKTKVTLQNITEVTTEEAKISVYVFDNDQAQSIEDAKEYDFGILATLDRENTDETLERIEENIGCKINVIEYEGITQVADAMMDNKVQAVIINESYLDVLASFSEEETESVVEEESTELYPEATRDYAAYVESLRELTEYTIATEKEEVQENSTYENNGTFVVYVSGIDTFGDISTKSRSDVNILAVVNTNTKQVLLVSTPRDYYVPLSISNGAKDKLTHAGIYGIECSEETLEMLYGVNIDYYFRVNFSGFENIIDTLGGVTVWSDYEFDVEPDFHYVKGDNYLNGIEALAFARERHAFANGDNQRGMNQMNVIISVIDKCTSSAVLKNYSELLDSLGGSFETDMPYETMSSIVRQQLAEGTKWDISTYSVCGTGAKEYTYSISSKKVYVMNPDEASVEEAKAKIADVLEGKIISGN